MVNNLRSNFNKQQQQSEWMKKLEEDARGAKDIIDKLQKKKLTTGGLWECSSYPITMSSTTGGGGEREEAVAGREAAGGATS
eukprot:779000-Prorocentrum_minimum.AAC.1